MDTVLSIPHGRVFPSLSLLLGFGIYVNEHLNLLPGHFGGDRAKIEGAQSMPVRRPRKTHYVGYVPSLAPSAIPISDLEFPSWEGNARWPHSTWARVTSLTRRSWNFSPSLRPMFALCPVDTIDLPPLQSGIININ